MDANTRKYVNNASERFKLKFPLINKKYSENNYLIFFFIKRSDFECRNNQYPQSDTKYFDLYKNGFYLSQM